MSVTSSSINGVQANFLIADDLINNLGESIFNPSVNVSSLNLPKQDQISLEDVAEAFKKWSVVGDGGVITLSQEQYEALIQPQLIQWDGKGDNEGLMSKAAWLAKKDREDEIKRKAELVTLEIDPIQDRDV